MCAGKQKGLVFFSVRQDGGADPLWFVFHGYSAGPVGARWGRKMRKIGNKTYINMCKPRYK